MPTFKKELVRGASYEITPDTRRLVRMWKVNNIDLTDTPDAEALVKVEAALASEGITMLSALSSEYSYLKLMRIRILPVLERLGKDVWVELEYGWEVPEFLPTMYIVRDSSVAVVRDTYYVPGTNTVNTIGFTAENDADGNEIPKVVADLVKMRIWMPSRAISVSALRYGRPSGGLSDKLCYVNHANWPQGDVILSSSSTIPAQAATSYPVGYWLLSEYKTEWYPNQAQTLVTATAVTQVVEDWSVILFVENRTTGKRPFGALPAATQQNYMNTLRNPSYSRGTIATVNGARRSGPYPTANFQGLFGF